MERLNLSMRPRILCLLLLPVLAGCASGGPRSDFDPLEDYNRAIFWFNNGVDFILFEPVATAWDFFVPDPVQDSLSSFFTNLAFPIYFVNNLLQGEPGYAFDELGRFIINSTVGGAGFTDIAAKWGIEPHREDFGQTLGVWGVRPGPFFMIPILGPTNFRDGVGLIADGFSQPLNYLLDPVILGSAAGANFINEKARNLRLMEAFEESALDPYVAMRDAYFQKRQDDVANGMTETPKDESLYDLPEDE